LHLLKYPAEKGSIRVLDVWPIVHAERKSLADDLATLSPDQWATPSLCDGWDIHDVLVHLVATA
jgi:hypothetical protein